MFEREFDDRLGRALNRPEETARTYRLIWIGCGAGDLLLPGSQKLAEVLKAKNIPHSFRESPGFHGMPTFRVQLVELLPLLFR